MKDKPAEAHRRAFPSQLRAVEGGDLAIRGTAIKFGDVASFGTWSTEEFRRGAFKDRMGDTRLLIGHGGIALARADTGTLDLFEDDEGLQFSAELDPERQQAREIYSAIKRGDVDGVSVGFQLLEGSKVETTDRGGKPHDIVVRVSKLLEISLVDRPAYTSSEVHPRRLCEDQPVKWTEEERAVFRRIRDARV